LKKHQQRHYNEIGFPEKKQLAFSGKWILVGILFAWSDEKYFESILEISESS